MINKIVSVPQLPHSNIQVSQTAMTDMVFFVGGIWINTMGSLVNFDVKWYDASPFVGEFNF